MAYPGLQKMRLGGDVAVIESDIVYFCQSYLFQALVPFPVVNSPTDFPVLDDTPRGSPDEVHEFSLHRRCTSPRQTFQLKVY